MTKLTKKTNVIKTMSSLEIAELTGKEHRNILRDIRSMLKDLTCSDLSFVCESDTYIGPNNQKYPMFNLDKDTTLTLLLGYDVVARMKVVKRWAQLEEIRAKEEANPDELITRYEENWRKKGRSDEWIISRLRAIASRHQFTDTLKEHHVTGSGYALCTNNIYTPLFGGGAKAIRKKKNLPENANVRDNMSSLELTAVNFAEELAKDRIVERNLNGNTRCSNAAFSAATIVVKAIHLNRKDYIE